MVTSMSRRRRLSGPRIRLGNTGYEVRERQHQRLIRREQERIQSYYVYHSRMQLLAKCAAVGYILWALFCGYLHVLSLKVTTVLVVFIIRLTFWSGIMILTGIIYWIAGQYYQSYNLLITINYAWNELYQRQMEFANLQTTNGMNDFHRNFGLRQ